MRYLYFHGFASGPASRKARFFAEKFAGLGLELETPDLTPSADQGGFQALTISGQLRLIESMVGSEPCVLMGSSMGGYLSALYASQQENVARIAILAPAFCLARRWREAWADRLETWKSTGSLEVFHYASNGPARIGYGLLEDADQYPDYPPVQRPALIFHGRQDPIVPVEFAREFHRRTPGSRLHEYDSGHELTDCMDAMWAQVEPFVSA